MGDHSSKWYEAVRMPNQEAKTVAGALVETWISRFGCPVNLHSDKGTNFMSQLVRDLCRILSIQRTYRSSVHAVTKYSPAYVIFGTPLKLPIDNMYETRQTESNPTPSDLIFKTRRELHKAHHQIRIHMEVEQTRQKTYYDYRAYGPTYKEGQQVFVFFTTVKIGETKKFSSHLSTKDLKQLSKLLTTLNFGFVTMRQRKLLKCITID